MVFIMWAGWKALGALNDFLIIELSEEEEEDLDHR